MGNRTVYHVVPDANSWKVTLEGSGATEILVDDKDNAVAQARELAKSAPLGQVIVHGRDGKIQDEFTYGADPRSSKG